MRCGICGAEMFADLFDSYDCPKCGSCYTELDLEEDNRKRDAELRERDRLIKKYGYPNIRW